MLKNGITVYIKVKEEFSDYAIVFTMDGQYSGIIYYKDFADRGSTGHRPRSDVFFQALVEKYDKEAKRYIFKQIPLVWNELKNKIIALLPDKELLCRVDIVKKDECELVIVDPALSFGEYHLQGILKREDAKIAFIETLNLNHSVNEPNDKAMHEILWEGDMVYACCIHKDHENCRLLMSLDRWLEKREKMSDTEIQDMNRLEGKFKDLKHAWADENNEIRQRAATIKKKIKRVILLDNEERSGKVASELGNAIGIRIDSFTRSEAVFAALTHSPDLYQLCLMDYHLAGDDSADNGIKAANLVHGIAPHLPVVLFSAYLEKIKDNTALLEKHIYGPYPRFQGGNMGLLTCLEIGAGIKAYKTPKAEEIHTTKKSGKTTYLQEQISLTARKYEQLYEYMDSFYLFGFMEEQNIPKCHYNRGKDLKRSELEKLDLSFFQKILDSQSEVWLHDWSNQEHAKTMKALQIVFSFRSLFIVPLSTRGSEKYLLIALNKLEHQPDSNGKEKIRHLATLFAGTIQDFNYAIDRISYLKTHTLGSIIEGIAHDLNHKLNDLENEAKILQLSLTDASQEKLDSIFTGIKDIMHDARTYTEHILHLQKGTEGSEYLADVLKVIKAVITSFAIRRRTVIRIHSHIPSVLIPGREIRTIIFNLLHNAIRYGKPTREADGIIEITAEKRNKKNVIIRLKDHGIGIHKAHYQRIFERGFSTRSGSGLGLAICREITQLIGGRLEVENSILYGGTTFLLELPVTGA